VAQGRDPGNYCVVRLSLSELERLELTVVRDESPDAPPGHAFIPQITPAAYKRDKQRLKELTLELARLATENIVLRPAEVL
jgi:hypothetical protein